MATNTQEYSRNYYTKNKERYTQNGLAYMQTMAGKFKSWKANAKRRGINWDLSIENLQTIPLVCHFTGDSLTMQQGFGHTVSLDRIDSTLGYIDGNVTFCRTDINWMKGILAKQDFIDLCKKVAKSL